MDAVEIRTIAKVSRRLVPFLIVCYFVAYLDRVNVGFAALTMNQDLGLSQPALGFGAGILFIAYFIFEVPSNLLLERFGARKWIARIMLSWGIISGMMAFTPAIARVTGLGNEYSFYLIRVLLGAAEAGFFPASRSGMACTGRAQMARRTSGARATQPQSGARVHGLGVAVEPTGGRAHPGGFTPV